MPRYRPSRDAAYYDTILMETGQKETLFWGGNKRSGEATNLHDPQGLMREHNFIIYTIGLRLIDKTRAEEHMLLDHLRLVMMVGDLPQYNAPGVVFAMIPDSDEKRRFGYRFGSPIRIPERQHFCVLLYADPHLPEAVVARVHLFGVVG